LSHGLIVTGVIATLTGAMFRVKPLEQYHVQILSLILTMSPIIYFFLFYSYLRLERMTVTPAKYIQTHLRPKLCVLLRSDDLFKWEEFLVETRKSIIERRGSTWIIGVAGIYPLLCILLLLISFIFIFLPDYFTKLAYPNDHLSTIEKISLALFIVDIVLFKPAWSSTKSTSESFLKLTAITSNDYDTR